MFRPSRALLFLIPLGLAASGCPAKEAKKPAPTTELKPPPPAPRAACVQKFSATGAPKPIDVGAHKFTLTGSKLAATLTEPDGKTVLGVVANIKEDTSTNLANVATLIEKFKAANADAIIIDGDSGETAGQIERALSPFSKSGIPTFVAIGNRESVKDYEAAVKKFEGAGVFDLGRIRLVTLDGVALVSMPGYYNPAYIHVKGGCRYHKGDLQDTAEAVKAAGPLPVVFISHGGPQQTGPEALDRTLEQDNVGDPAMTRFIRENGIKFGIFANIHESGGRGTNLEGERLISPQTWSEELFINPGAADSVSWKMNDGTRSVGMGATLTFEKGKASFIVHRMTPTE